MCLLISHSVFLLSIRYPVASDERIDANGEHSAGLADFLFGLWVNSATANHVIIIEYCRRNDS